MDRLAERRRRVRPTLRLLLVSLLPALWLAPLPAQQDPAVQPTRHPLLWRIDGNPPSYVYGTIHLPEARVLALPAVVSEAVQACDALYTEVPLDPSTMQAAAEAAMLPGDTTLADVLPREVYQRVDAYLTSKGYGIAPFVKLKPWALMSILSMIDYLQQMATTPALDASLYAQAQQAGKRTGALETVDEQLGALESLTDDESVAILVWTLDLLEQDPQATEKLVQGYLGGDLARLEALMNEGLDRDDPVHRKYYDNLLTVRDARMAERAAEAIRSNPGTSFFFAVGAAHLGVDRGVLALLQADGFQLERLTAEHAGRLTPVGAGAGQQP